MNVFIPTAGIGSRLKEKTYNLNKSLLNINNKPIISHIIESFPKKTKFVIALGFKGSLVRQFIKLAYPKRNIKFVKIWPYKGKKSGLGLTLLKSKKFLKKEFIFISCDTLIKEKIKKTKYNWIGYSNIKARNQYRSINFKKNQLININEKNIKFKDKFSYIGLAFIKDFKEFWDFTKKNYKFSKNQGEVFGLNKIVKNKKIFIKKFTWNDTGTLQMYEKTNKKYFKKNQPVILPKKNEFISFTNDNVIKYSSDKDFIKKRVKRSKILKNFVPKVTGYSENFYTYKYVSGKIMSKNLSLKKFINLLKFLNKFWKKNRNIKKINFKSKCLNFYRDKTIERIKKFNTKYNFKDDENFINNIKIERLNKILKKIDWNWLSKGISVRFHGDLHFENIIIQKKTFRLLDWRQDFQNDIINGDIYYDLAKILHGLIVDHNQVDQNKYKIHKTGKRIKLSIKQSKNHKICQKYFEKWIIDNNFNLKKVRILTALIYLNISPLHHYPYSFFLYYLGKKMLSDELNSKI
tara:strand:+ start:3905 stop:5461 length:1557 start_codon:yes stop_codon:yes gene_type:complete